MWGAVRKLASAIALLVACCAFPLAAQTVTVTVTWAPGAGGQATSFIVQRSQAQPGPLPPYTTIATVMAPSACSGLTGTETCTVTYADSASSANPLPVGGVFYYQVMASNATGNSPPTNSTSVTITPQPGKAPLAPNMVGAIVTWP
jgi:hypothetical protein